MGAEITTTKEDFTQTLGDYFGDHPDDIAQIMKATAPVFDDPRFWDWPASAQNKEGKSKHHGERGGLARHTNEVLRNALAAASAFVEDKSEDVNRVVLAVGAIWHDMGKLDEYKVQLLEDPKGKCLRSERTTEAFLLSHIVRGISHWSSYACYKGFYQPFTDQVTHVIASHHGRREWGSPVVPQTIEALLVHQADMLSVMTDGGENPNLRS